MRFLPAQPASTHPASSCQRARTTQRQRTAEQMLAALSPRARHLFVSHAGPAAWARLCYEAGATVREYTAPLQAAPSTVAREAARTLRYLVTAPATA